MSDLGTRSGRTRPSRLAFVVASRQSTEIVRPALTLRIIALSVALTVFVQLEHPVAIALSLPALAICMLRTRTVPTLTSAQSTGRRPVGATEPSDQPVLVAVGSATRRRRWIVASWWDLLSALLVVAVAAWGTVALPAGPRFLALTAGAVLLAVVSARLCLDPRWHRPQPQPRRLARLLRTFAGPLGSAACLALALPAPWGPGERTIVGIISLLPMANVAMIQDQDLTVQGVVEMIRTEAQDGRQTVLDELHGNLSTNLRLLEQATHELRTASPRLFELAVGANSRLRETLTLADPQLDSADEPQTLGALVRTLAMAVGARADLTVELDRLSEADRDVLRLVLNDAVGVVLADGASRVRANVVLADGSIVVSIVGGGSRQPDRTSRLTPLRRRLDTLGGTIAEEHNRSDARRALVIRWPASPGTA